MAKKHKKHASHVPHLLRRRGAKKFWTGWLHGKEVSLGTSDPADAQQRLNQLAAQRDRAEGSPAAPKVQKLSEAAFLFAEYCRPPRHTKQTGRLYERLVTHFVEWTEARKVTLLAQVTPVLLTAYVQDRSKAGVGGATINRHLSALCSFFDFSVLQELLPASPVDGTLKKKLRMRESKPSPKGTTLSPEQVDAFLAAAKQRSHEAYASLFRLTAGTGLRIDEARHLEPSDIDRRKGYITVSPKKDWTSKGYRYRDVPASEDTKAAARKFIELRDQVPLDDKSVWAEIKRVRGSVGGLPHFSIHDLRRAWASAVHANGASLKQVSVWLGHSGLQVTERYIRLVEEEDGHRFLPR